MIGKFSEKKLCILGFIRYNSSLDQWGGRRFVSVLWGNVLKSVTKVTKSGHGIELTKLIGSIPALIIE